MTKYWFRAGVVYAVLAALLMYGWPIVPLIGAALFVLPAAIGVVRHRDQKGHVLAATILVGLLLFGACASAWFLIGSATHPMSPYNRWGPVPGQWLSSAVLVAPLVLAFVMWRMNVRAAVKPLGVRG